MKKLARVVQVEFDGPHAYGLEIPQDVFDELEVVDGQILEITTTENSITFTKTPYIHHDS